MIGVNIKFNAEDINRLNRKFASFSDNMDEGIRNISLDTEREIKFQLISQTKLASRLNMASRIKSVRLKKLNYGITMPMSAVYLDSMVPHFVALKRGRRISAWATKYFGKTARKTGQSNVSFTRNGVKGAVFVSPDPFVSKALNRVRARYKGRLKDAIRKTFKQGRA